MPRYIDVDELLRKPPDIHDYYDESGEKDCAHGYTIATIKSATTLSPDDVRGVGEWEDAKQHGMCRCSVCKDCYIEKDYITQAKWKYCPNCGARMKGAEDGTTDNS